MGKMQKHCIGEVSEIYERYCFNMRDKLPTESVDSFVAELRNLAKTCNFCDCLRDSLIRDRIVLGIKNEQTTKKLLRMRDLTLNRCIDVCRSEKVAELQMKSLSGPVDNINQVKSLVLRSLKLQRRTGGRQRKFPANFVATTINLTGRCALHGKRSVSDARKRVILPRSVRKFLSILLRAKRS